MASETLINCSKALNDALIRLGLTSYYCYMYCSSKLYDDENS